MSDPLFFGCLAGVTVGGLLHLDGADGRHAAKVRRIRVGEQVLVADAEGRAIRGVTQLVGADFIDVRVDECLREPGQEHWWTVVQALAKGGRDEQAVEAMTELGVDAVVAWQASRSVVQWHGAEKQAKGLVKWQSTVREAAKQSRRFRVPNVACVTSTSDVCKCIRAAAQAFVLHESASEFLDTQALVSSGEVLFIVGPEGGITPDELEAFEAAGAKPVLIADHVLRTSTAGVVALAQLQTMARAAS